MWIEIKNINDLPLETDIIVKHQHGVEAIHFFNHTWSYWYTEKQVPTEVLKTITHFMAFS